MLVLMPLAFIESATVFVDNVLTMYTVAALIFAARLRETPSQVAIAGFAIASAGAVAVKLHGVLAFASIVWPCSSSAARGSSIA